MASAVSAPAPSFGAVFWSFVDAVPPGTVANTAAVASWGATAAALLSMLPVLLAIAVQAASLALIVAKYRREKQRAAAESGASVASGGWLRSVLGAIAAALGVVLLFRVFRPSDASAATAADLPPTWFTAAGEDAARGLAEKLPNGKPNPEVQRMYPVAGYPPNSDCRKIPWCSIYMCFLIEAAGLVSTRSASARSWRHWGVEVDPNDVRPGDIAVFWRGKHNDGVSGHVGQFVRWGKGKKSIIVRGGNQGDKVSDAEYPGRQWLAFRRPPAPPPPNRARTGSATAAVGAGGAAVGTVAVATVAGPPDPSPAPTVPVAETVDKLVTTGEALKGPLTSMGAYKVILGVIVVCALISIAGIWYAHRHSTRALKHAAGA